MRTSEPRTRVSEAIPRGFYAYERASKANSRPLERSNGHSELVTGDQERSSWYGRAMIRHSLADSCPSQAWNGRPEAVTSEREAVEGAEVACSSTS